MSFVRNNSTATTVKDQDELLRAFFDGLGFKVTSAITKKQKGYWHYNGQCRGFNVIFRVASKIMSVGHRVLWVDMIYGSRIFCVAALDSMNKFAPTKIHIENMEVGLARVVYNK